MEKKRRVKVKNLSEREIGEFAEKSLMESERTLWIS